jgi:hypothetical protein
MTKYEGTTLLEPIITIQEIFEDKKCEWKPCSLPATHWLVCPICSSKELQCDVHTEMVKKAPIGESVLFNVTCQHMVQQMECGVEKI